jgi:hypothetical protein
LASAPGRRWSRPRPKAWPVHAQAKVAESEQRSRRFFYAADMNLAQQALKVNNLGRARRLCEVEVFYVTIDEQNRGDGL